MDSPVVRPADPQRVEQLISELGQDYGFGIGQDYDMPIYVSDNDDDVVPYVSDSDPEEDAQAAAAAAEPKPLILLSRVVGGEDAYSPVQCLVQARDCSDHLPSKFVNMQCRHAYCFDCFKSQRLALGDSARITCPVCKTLDTVIENERGKNEPAANGFILGVIFRLKVRCPYGCPAEYEIGHDYRGERDHLKNCGFSPATCPDCRLEMIKDELADHRAVCPSRTTKCDHCHEDVRNSDLAAHNAGARLCVGMVPCPLGCVASPDIVKHAPHPKRARGEFDALRQEHATLVPRKELEAHKLVCPCRPAVCPFPGCTHELLEHEVKRHSAKRKFMEQHLMCMVKARADDRAEFDRKLLALTPHNRGNPFHGYTQLFSDVFRVPTKAFLNHADWHWPAPKRINGPPTNTLRVISVLDIKRIVFDVSSDSADNRLLKKLSLDVLIEPLEGHQPRPRKLGISVRLCRKAQPGDNSSVKGACVDPGVDTPRMINEFTISGDLARHQVDVFAYEIMYRAALQNAFVLHGRPDNLLLFVELFELMA
jgi:hypothetical protein